METKKCGHRETSGFSIVTVLIRAQEGKWSVNLPIQSKVLHGFAAVLYLSVCFDRYWLNQVGVARKNIAATDLLWLGCRLSLQRGDRDIEKGLTRKTFTGKQRFLLVILI